MNPGLPMIGFGFDAQYSHRYPYGMAGLCDLYRSRLSHLSVVSLANPRAAQEFIESCAKDLPVVHHLSGVAPADADGPHLDRLRALDRISDVLHPVWSCEDVGIWSIGPYAIPYFAPPIFEEDVANLVADRIREILSISPYRYSAELPACPFVVGDMTLGDFFHRLVERSGCKVVLDVSHVFSYAVARRQDPFSILATLPLSAVCEMHVSGGILSHDSSNRYVDTHSHPVMQEVVSLATEAVRLCAGLQCITYEIGVGLSAEAIEHDVYLLEKTLTAAKFSPFNGGEATDK